MICAITTSTNHTIETTEKGSIMPGRYCFYFVSTILWAIFLFNSVDSIDLCSKQPGISVKETRIEGVPHKLHWLKEGDKGLVFCTTSGNKPTILRSHDDGANWEDLGKNLKDLKGSSLRGTITVHYPFTYSQFIYLTAEGNNDLWVSEDAGKTFSYRKMPSELTSISDFKMDHIKTKRIYAVSPSTKCVTDYENCYHELWKSEDAGKTWKMIRSPVFTEFTIGKESEIWVRDRLSESKGRMMSSKDGGDNWQVVFYDCDGFAERDGVYFGVIDKQEEGYSLFISGNFGRDEWVQAKFPTALTERRYTIVFASEAKVMIHVNHGGDFYGNLYSSNGPSQREFVLSLENHKSSWQGYGELLQIPQIPGVLVANSVSSNPFDPRDSVISHISFNNGGDWSSLSAPVVDMNGKSIDCKEKIDQNRGKCTLNLNGPYEDSFGKMMAPIHAIGLILATGTVGTATQSASEGSKMSTWLSRDAGVHWKQVLPYSSIYNVANHGSLILAMKHTSQHRNISYSWNFGNDWNECLLPFGFYVTKVHTGYNGTSLHFIIEGEQVENGKSSGVLVHFDLSGMHTKKCTDKDYEKWTPTNGKDATHCLLGKSNTYKRRKTSEKCFTGSSIERVAESSICPCGVEDYECDFCHERQGGSSICSLVCDEKEFRSKEAKCIDGYQSISQGYRLIMGTECDVSKGLNLTPGKIQCTASPSGVSMPLWETVVLMLLCIFGTLLFLVALFIAFRKNERFNHFVTSFTSRLPKKIIDPFRSVEFVRLNTEEDEESAYQIE
eukprot:TRINITY_DN2640_c0_g1_i1.p2 TRINITY_DN2640_c0_g1~~TRINITY_DN2640_c0_g1_i1.p2  ORF type:complete len:780 (-),score=223.58 TRINITY_DN2640_c0_g1_i1:514-2853(-)